MRSSPGIAEASVGSWDRRRRPPAPSVREDCWSEEETAALVAAWGARFVALNGGHIRQHQWQEVADVVNSRPGATRRRPPRSEVQCKNRIDTVKKRYKSELARVNASGRSSDWRFYDYLDSLIGSGGCRAGVGAVSGAKAKSSPPSSPSNTMSSSPQVAPPPASLVSAWTLGNGNAVLRNAAIAAAAAAANGIGNKSIRNAAVGEKSDNGDHEEDEVESRSAKRQQLGSARSAGQSGMIELARAIEKFADVYEKVEEAKQQREDEMGRERMEFLRALEMKKMKAIVGSLGQLRTELNGMNGVGADELLGQVAALPLQSAPVFL